MDCSFLHDKMIEHKASIYSLYFSEIDIIEIIGS